MSRETSNPGEASRCIQRDRSWLCAVSWYTSRTVNEVDRAAGGSDEALSAKDMPCPVCGVALAPVLEALWIYMDGEIENCFCLA